ncbi:MAG: SCP2 sterol-binding domain-containing protein [Humibacillus sp.]|nr:SCP2 sterol-binding domain-containing protein [Humibacillus sp.]MDN5778594.1 SCP2 sterol-binding domain-containing protein [Humibacillus sp.]
MSDIDLTTATPEQLDELGQVRFMQAVRAMPDAALAALMRGPNRSIILAQIFPRMPRLFRPDKAGGVTATTHWSITDGPGGSVDDWTVRVSDGTCTVKPGLAGDAAVSLAMSGVTFFKLITKSGNPVMMYMTGKLRISGDVGLAAGIGSWFDSPGA